ncbi:MAG: alpha/beta hydrolase [Xanthobacteraceae bacterium]
MSTPVYLDYDQAALDAAYDQAVYAANRDQLRERRDLLSEEARARLGPPLRFAYGESPIEQLDVYRADAAEAPIFVFVHGGAWRNGKGASFAFPAEMFVAAGAHYVVLDFLSVDDAGGSLVPMVDQVRRAVAWVYGNAARFGGDPRRLYLSGHSSGAHLTGVVLTTEWDRTFGLPDDVVKGALCCSGMYDLKPVRLSARSRYVHLDDATEDALSVQRHINQLHTPLIVAYGTRETPEFQRQSRDFAAALKAAAKPVELLVGRAYNHFEILETLANPLGLLGRAALRQMGLRLP